jgi:hypothetical protein
MGFFGDFLASRYASGGLVPTYTEAVQAYPVLSELRGLSDALKQGHLHLTMDDQGRHVLAPHPDQQEEGCLDCEVHGHIMGAALDLLDSPNHNDLSRLQIWHNIKSHIAINHQIVLNPKAIQTDPPLPRHEFEPLLYHYFNDIPPHLKSPFVPREQVSMEDELAHTGSKNLLMHLTSLASAIKPGWSTFIPTSSQYSRTNEQIDRDNEDLSNYDSDSQRGQEQMAWKREHPLTFRTEGL